MSQAGFCNNIPLRNKKSLWIDNNGYQLQRLLSTNHMKHIDKLDLTHVLKADTLDGADG